MKKLKLGLVGCGKMMYSHCLSILEAGVDITAVCDLYLENAEATAKALDNPFITTDYREMVGHCDAVLVATPPHNHYEIGVFFARNKIHVLMEKPMCITDEECVRLTKVCDDEGVVLMCAYPVPYRPAVRKLKEMVTSGDYGKVIMMSSWTEQNTPVGEYEYGASSQPGGGQFWGHGCHYVDILLEFLGNPVRGSHIGTKAGYHHYRLKETTSIVTMEFENGAIGYHTATWSAHGTRLGWVLDIQTEKGLIHYDREDGEILFYDKLKQRTPGEIGNKDFEVVWKEDGKKSKQTQFEIRHFADCVLNNKVPETNGHRAMQSLRVIRKLYDAEHQGIVADLRGLGFAQK